MFLIINLQYLTERIVLQPIIITLQKMPRRVMCAFLLMDWKKQA